MRPERQHEHHSSCRRAEQQPWTVASPAGTGTVAQRTDHGVIDGIPEAGDQHQEGHCRHADAADIGVKNHQEVANEHPAEVAAHIAHAVSDFTDQRDFDVRILLFRLCCVTHTARSFLLLTRCL